MRRRLPGTRADRAIIAAALVVVVVVGIATGAARSGPPTPYSSGSTAASGTLALYRWVAALGYRPRQLTDGPLRPAGLRALVVLEPQAAFAPGEIAAMRRWLQGGGVLVLLEDDGGDPALANAFGLAMQPLPTPGGLSGILNGNGVYGAAPVQPLLMHPPLHGLSADVTAGVYGGGTGAIPLLGSGGVRRPGGGARTRVPPPDAANPVLVYERVGRGRLYAGSIPAVVTNGQIARSENRRLMPNLLAGLPAGAAVGFDEYHLVIAPASQPTLGAVLVTTDWGRALIYALALAAAYIVLTGRRLGRPLRAVPERGRSLMEYVTSMAATFRRAGLRDRVLALWQDDLRRTLSGPAGARGRSDADLVAEAAQRARLSPDEESEALALLRPRAAIGEAALVDLCRRIARLQERVD